MKKGSKKLSNVKLICKYKVRSTVDELRSSAEIAVKKYPHASKFLKDVGVGEGKLLLRSFLPP